MESATSLATVATQEDIEEQSSIKLIEIIFLPFHPIFKFFVVATAILKVYLVRIYGSDTILVWFISSILFNNNLPVFHNQQSFVPNFLFHYYTYHLPKLNRDKILCYWLSCLLMGLTKM